MTQAEIEQRLHLHEVDHAELAELLLWHYGSARTVDDKHVSYPDAEPAELLVEYSGSRIWRILPQPSMVDETLFALERRVLAELLAATVPGIARFVMFSRRPVEGYWRHRDHVVLRQPPSDWPQAHELSSIHPLLCEVAYEGSVESHTDMRRRDRQAKHAKLLLSILVPGLSNQSVSTAQFAWVLPPAAGPDSPRGSVCLQEMYWPGEFDARADRLTAPSAPDMPSADDLYGGSPWMFAWDQTLLVPTSLGLDIDRFQALDRSRRREFLRAAFWQHQAQLLWSRSPSASYQALIQSIEVLAAATPHSDGARKQFKAFLRDYAPGDWGGADELYRMRSLIVHGNTLMLADEEGFGLGLSPRARGEDHLHNLAATVSRAAAINWLRGEKLPPDQQ